MVGINSLKSSSVVPASVCGPMGWFNSKLNKVKHVTDFAVVLGRISFMTPQQSAYLLLEREK